MIKLCLRSFRSLPNYRGRRQFNEWNFPNDHWMLVISCGWSVSFFPVFIDWTKVSQILNIQLEIWNKKKWNWWKTIWKKIVKLTRTQSFVNVIPPTHSGATRSLVRGWGVFSSKSWGWCSPKLWTTEFWSTRFRLNLTPQGFFWSDNSVKNYQSSYPLGLSDITRCSLSDLRQLLLETKTAWHL